MRHHKQPSAEEIGLSAFSWLLEDPDRAGSFLGWSGTDPSELAGRLEDPVFLGFVLDFLLMEDEQVTAFCAAAGLKTDAPMRARQALPGGDLPNWT
ncbi:DUF3572 family protein [Paroceanicella profunda]|uniref:DUF3572 family protein n=1 Tax=Paroceanicella profunda TaxID=2579971 RepID=A0A5B8FV54_9RHOB|nr:DUF3572 domain-containing protein [Paroceanicella profunda]QDL90339.1 DUF3572 family protein [Paroceanicella profunda]